MEGRALHQPPRVGLSAGAEEAAPPPAPAVEKYRGAEVPAPCPAPGPAPAPPGPLGKPPPVRPRPRRRLPPGSGRPVLDACWGWASRAARPVTSPVAARARPRRARNEGCGGEGADFFSKIAAPEELPARSPFPKPRPQKEPGDKKSPRALGPSLTAFQATGAREPAPGWRVGWQIGRPAGWRGQIGSQAGRRRKEIKREPECGAQILLVSSRPPAQTHWRPRRTVTRSGWALPAQPEASRPRPSRRLHTAPPFRECPPGSRLLQRLGDSGDTQTRAPTPTFAARQTSWCVHHTLTHRCPHACAITHNTHTTRTRWSRGSAPKSHQPHRPPAGPTEVRAAAPLPSAPLPCCSPRPRRAGSAPRCAQVAFLKGKLHQPPEALCRRESARPAAPFAAPPELVVFWFRGGGG